ncbi:L-iditol 2-dehydrogenase [Sporothrix schenckii 1099-18]|uniref:L-iditol 2-dehydrogenase n=1 Tax=Sporothrix schenckii 1099-18 TaxID=1397361 RepID=A0A0F2MGD0_SPOSC|nr:L-iditol 2-dehydrogenase [Sporothrix schenckii 1099-18]KJR88119.1 L-iditol 2-dehydrogenase [Sporothrix schenckii 1099-18]
MSTSQTQTIKASVLHGAKDLRLEDRSLEPPAASEVQVAVRATGLCGSDLHYYGHYRNGDILVREPLSLGHESAGEVVAVGPGVSSLKVGDFVALEVGQPCGTCARCAEGRYNICPEMRFRSSAKSFPHAQGTLQDRINHPAAWCHKLPASMPLAVAALLEPLSVAIQATRRANLSAGHKTDKVLVLGAGAVGLLVAGMCKVAGVPNVVIADVDANRARFAVEHRFADTRFVVPMGPRPATTDEALATAQQTAAAVGALESKGGMVGQVDVVFECTGVPSCVQTAMYATRPGGKVMLIGMGTPVQTLPISAAALREVDICGVFRYANTYAEGIEILSRTDNDGPDFASLVTHEFKGLAAVEDAFAMASRKEDDDGKLVIKVLVTN